jgi:hypothetical protein
MSKLLQYFFYYQIIIKIFHWQTRKYSEHIASDQLYTSLLTLIDQWVEVYQGKYDILTFKDDEKVNVPLRNVDRDDFILHLKQFKIFLMKTIPEHLNNDKKMENTDLLNIRDEMLALTNKTLYLLTLE